MAFGRGEAQAHLYDNAVEQPVSSIPRWQSRATAVEPGERRWVPAALLVVLGGGLALRLWGVAQGLPYLYNNDEGEPLRRSPIRWLMRKGKRYPEEFKERAIRLVLEHREEYTTEWGTARIMPRWSRATWAMSREPRLAPGTFPNTRSHE